MSIELDILSYLSTERGPLFRGTLVTEMTRNHALLPDVWSDCSEEDDLQSAIDRLIASGKITQDSQKNLRVVAEPIKPAVSRQAEVF